MLDDYSGYSTNGQKTLWATLMYHCGVACHMAYSSTQRGIQRRYGRGACLYFGYDKGLHLPKDLPQESDLSHDGK